MPRDIILNKSSQTNITLNITLNISYNEIIDLMGFFQYKNIQTEIIILIVTCNKYD